MAFTKKTVTKVDKSKEVENLVETIPAEENGSDVELLKKQLISTQNQLDELRALIVNNSQKHESTTNADSMDRWCTIVHLEDRAEGLYTIFRSSLMEYRFCFFGETRKVRRAELDDIISKNRKWFEKLVVTLGADDSDLIEEYGLPKAEKVILHQNQLTRLPALSLEDLKKLYEKVCDTHKQLMIRKWVIGYYENKDGNYRNLNKINLLNDLSNGAMSHILDDMTEQKRIKRS